MAIAVRKARFVYTTSNECPLGQVSVVAYGRGSPEIGRNGPLRVFGSYAVVMLLHGAGRYRDADGANRRLSAGDCVIVLPDVGHAYYQEPGDERWDQIYAIFAGPAFNQWQSSGVLSPGRLVYRADPLEYWHAKLLQCATPDPLIAVTRMQVFLADLLHANAALTGEANEQWLAQATQLIGIGPKPDWQQVADELGCGYETFRKRFARLTGQSPAQFHAKRAIEHACELMRDPDRSLREIAIECGFCDEFHFSRRFTRLIGVRPSVLRHQIGVARNS